MSNLILPRRGFLVGLASFLAAPAVVEAENLMPDGGHMNVTSSIVRAK